MSSVANPARMAWRRYQEIELRTPNSFPALIFDCDSQPQDYLAVAFGALVRPPNWIVSNPETGNAHIVYCLARPVLHGDCMRLKPLKFRQRIAEYYRMVYGADSGYAGVLTHNPVHPKWDVTWWREEPLDAAGAGRGHPQGLAAAAQADDAGGPQCHAVPCGAALVRSPVELGVEHGYG